MNSPAALRSGSTAEEPTCEHRRLQRTPKRVHYLYPDTAEPNIGPCCVSQSRSLSAVSGSSAERYRLEQSGSEQWVTTRARSRPAPRRQALPPPTRASAVGRGEPDDVRALRTKRSASSRRMNTSLESPRPEGRADHRGRRAGAGCQGGERRMKPDQDLTEPSHARAQRSYPTKKHAVTSGFCEADEGTRTLDLLHCKPCRRSQRTTTDVYDR